MKWNPGRMDRSPYQFLLPLTLVLRLLSWSTRVLRYRVKHGIPVQQLAELDAGRRQDSVRSL